MTKDQFTDAMGEGLHTALRKVGDSAQADRAWKAINEMDPAEWSRVLDFVAYGFEVMGLINFEES